MKTWQIMNKSKKDIIILTKKYVLFCTIAEIGFGQKIPILLSPTLKNNMSDKHMVWFGLVWYAWTLGMFAAARTYQNSRHGHGHGHGL